MTSPDSNPCQPRVALFSNGAHYSRAVLQALQNTRCAPDLLLLPEYPPAQASTAKNRELFSSTRQDTFLQQVEGIELVFAPQERQAESALKIKEHRIDFILVACWPYLINQSLIDSATRAALNLHPSLLPRYRGPDPLEQQLDAGDRSFGVTLHLLNARFDQGDIISQAALEDPGPDPGRDALEQLCAVRGVELFRQAVDNYERGWKPIAQLAYSLETL